RRIKTSRISPKRVYGMKAQTVAGAHARQPSGRRGIVPKIGVGGKRFLQYKLCKINRFCRFARLLPGVAEVFWTKLATNQTSKYFVATQHPRAV
ncbi:hypothetical protein, partial [Rivihabitans pingtungensis]|uniref:hypothetical protein n=1 Tax=Rivihabitans pingtungensis TaxID=1054498 RepID=UPI002FDA8AD6